MYSRDLFSCGGLTGGKEHAGAKTFRTVMNMPPPSAAKNNAKMSSVITTCLRSITKGSMRIAAEKVKGTQSPGAHAH